MAADVAEIPHITEEEEAESRGHAMTLEVSLQ